MVEQASLESKFNEQKCSNTEKFVMTEPLKKCIKCGEWKPKTEFYRHDTSKRRLVAICKKCNVEIHKERYINHDKEKMFLEYNSGKYPSGYYSGQGVCVSCGNFHPLMLENHHVLPKDDMVVSLCANCHRMYRSSIKEKHMISILNAIENSKFLWDSDGQPKGLKPVPMWTADLPLKEAIEILKSYDLPGYEPVGVEV